MPDFIVFTAIVARLQGAKVILDLHDLLPELFVDKKRGWKHLFVAWMLRREEKLSAGYAHHVIVSNHLWLKTNHPAIGPRGKVLRVCQPRGFADLFPKKTPSLGRKAHHPFPWIALLSPGR